MGTRKEVAGAAGSGEVWSGGTGEFNMNGLEFRHSNSRFFGAVKTSVLKFAQEKVQESHLKSQNMF